MVARNAPARRGDLIVDLTEYGLISRQPSRFAGRSVCGFPPGLQQHGKVLAGLERAGKKEVGVDAGARDGLAADEFTSGAPAPGGIRRGVWLVGRSGCLGNSQQTGAVKAL